jgi:hypothetical protein
VSCPTRSATALNVALQLQNRGAAESETQTLTLKAFANCSPVLRFGNAGISRRLYRSRNSEGVAAAFTVRKVGSQLLQSCDDASVYSSPGFQGQPWASISQHLRRKSLSFHTASSACVSVTIVETMTRSLPLVGSVFELSSLRADNIILSSQSHSKEKVASHSLTLISFIPTIKV